jgi:hypothetical protein
MFTMYDSTTEDQIPKEPHAVAAYINGKYENYDRCKQLFPHARILRLSVTGDVVADGYDMEKGDYQNDEAGKLYKIAKDAGVWRPCFYAQLSGNMPAVKKALNTVIAVRDDVRLWVAYYNRASDLPSEYDAHQFTDRALGRNLDESICADTFFQPAKVTPDTPAQVTAEAEAVVDVEDKAELTFNRKSGAWSVKGIPA